jgi:hypothetical protein
MTLTNLSRVLSYMKIIKMVHFHGEYKDRQFVIKQGRKDAPLTKKLMAQ